MLPLSGLDVFIAVNMHPSSKYKLHGRGDYLDNIFSFVPAYSNYLQACITPG